MSEYYSPEMKTKEEAVFHYAKFLKRENHTFLFDLAAWIQWHQDQNPIDILSSLNEDAHVYVMESDWEDRYIYSDLVLQHQILKPEDFPPIFFLCQEVDGRDVIIMPFVDKKEAYSFLQTYSPATLLTKTKGIVSMFEHYIQKLKTLIEAYEADPSKENEIRQFFYHNARDLIAKEVVIDTTWHIQDIRDFFTDQISDSQLIDVLNNIFRNAESSVDHGWEIIRSNINDAAKECDVHHLLLDPHHDEHDDNDDD